MRSEDFFYEGAERGDFLDALNGYAHEGATAVLEGEPGSGVSTLLGMLSMSLVEDYELVRLDGAEDLGANAVVDAMLVHFGVERADLADALKESLEDSRLIVVVDNTDEVSEAALDTMVSLKQRLRGRLTYLFGGHPGASDRLRTAGLTVADTLELPKLDAHHVIEFAEQALGMELTVVDAEELRLQSDGQPGRIWNLLDERNETRPGGGTRKPIPLRHSLAVVGLLVVVVVLWLASSGHDEPQDQVVQLELPAPPSGQQEQAAPQDEDTTPQFEGSGLITSPEQARRALAQYNPTARDLRKDETPPAPPADAATETGGDVEKTEGADAGAGQTEAPPAITEAPVTASQNDSIVTSSDDEAQTDKTASADASRPTGQQKPTGLDAELGYHQSDWLATRPASDWFLQVAGTSHEDGARRLLDTLNKEGAYYRTTVNGKAWYRIVVGPYPSRDAALKARQSLPEKLREGNPFPKEASSIQKELQ